MDLLEKLTKCADAIRKGTKGKWLIPKIADGTYLWAGPLLENTRACLHGGTRIIECNAFDLDDAELRELKRNLRSIVVAHNDAPRLLDAAMTEITALRARVEELQDAIDAAKEAKGS